MPRKVSRGLQRDYLKFREGRTKLTRALTASTLERVNLISEALSHFRYFKNALEVHRIELIERGGEVAYNELVDNCDRLIQEAQTTLDHARKSFD